MTKPLVAGLIFLVIVILGGSYFALHKTTNKTPQATPMNTMPKQTSSPVTSTAPTAANAVSVKNFAFSPDAITVKKGAVVTWTNNDATTHTITETDGQTGPSSGNLESGKSYSFTYSTVGTFHYHCAIHSEMTGTVTVTD